MEIYIFKLLLCWNLSTIYCLIGAPNIDGNDEVEFEDTFVNGESGNHAHFQIIDRIEWLVQAGTCAEF